MVKRWSTFTADPAECCGSTNTNTDTENKYKLTSCFTSRLSPPVIHIPDWQWRRGAEHASNMTLPAVNYGTQKLLEVHNNLEQMKAPVRVDVLLCENKKKRNFTKTSWRKRQNKNLPANFSPLSQDYWLFLIRKRVSLGRASPTHYCHLVVRYGTRFRDFKQTKLVLVKTPKMLHKNKKYNKWVSSSKIPKHVLKASTTAVTDSWFIKRLNWQFLKQNK